MNLYELIDINLLCPEVITFVGAGGKTTTMFKLAEELKHKNKKILITTTTSIFFPETHKYDTVLINTNPSINELKKNYSKGICILGSYVWNENKLKGISSSVICNIYEHHIFDYILIEGDGSKQKPVKAPDAHEPVIPKCTSKVIGVIGIDCIGTSISEKYVHRASLFSNITQKPYGSIIDENCVSKIVLDPKGLFKNVPQGSNKYLLLNKADNLSKIDMCNRIVYILDKEKHDIAAIIISSMMNNYIYRSDLYVQ